MSSGKDMIIRLKGRYIKKISSNKMSYYLEPDSDSRNKIKVEWDLLNYATKSEADNLDVDKPKRVPTANS